MDTPRSRILSKLRALRAKTPANGCTEAEALSAASLVARLLIEYDLTEADLGPTEDTAIHHESREPFSDTVGRIGQTIAIFCQVSACRVRGRTEVFGSRPDIELYDWLRETLHAAFIRAWTEYSLQSLDDPDSRTHLDQAQFLTGIAKRVAQRLSALIAEREAARPRGRGLIIPAHALAKAARDLAYPDLHASRGPRITAGPAYFAGAAAGDSVGLGRPISERGPNRALPAPKRAL